MPVDGETSLLVYPKLGRLTPRWLQVLSAGPLGNLSEGRYQGMLEGDYYGLREWRTGDSRRWIHWRTSAKLGELSVRQFEQQRTQDLTLVLDLWQPAAPTDAQRASTELAVSFAATAVADLCARGGGRLALGAAGATPRYWAGPATTILAQEFLDHLAEMEPGDGLSIYDVFDRLWQIGTAGFRTLVVSTREAPFQTSDDTWDPEAQAERSTRPYGNLTWVDCRGDALHECFVPAESGSVT
jgi:uncharacterized protein (DUF58 family)